MQSKIAPFTLNETASDWCKRNIGDPMNLNNQAEAIELIFKAFPYSNQIKEIEAKDDHIRFTWRNNGFRLNFSPFMIEQARDGVLISDDISILAFELLKREWLNIQLNKEIQ